MPNHCENELFMNGDPGDIEEVFAYMKTENNEFDFNQLIPYPQKYKEMDDERQRLGYEDFHKKYGKEAKDGFNAGGYDWCVDNWGTKWNAYSIFRDGSSVRFDTAWAPPEPIIMALAKKFPMVSFHHEYFEGGVGFAGGISYYGLCDFDERYEDEPFVPGTPANEWGTDNYRGRRGG